MFIKSLKISNDFKIIREMEFINGLNLIVDDTPTFDKKQTGNNVGKTTVLKLIYFCLGGDGNEIYTDEENRKAIYEDVKNFLIDNEILITLTLTESLDDTNSKTIIIERNFLTGKQAIRRINGDQVLQKDFTNELKSLIFPSIDSEKPTFKQLISHNIRYKDTSINNTLKTLHQSTTDVEYETLYLYMLGCNFDDADKKQALITKLKEEQNFKARLEKDQTKNSYEVALDLIENDIEELNEKKSSFNINENFEEDLEKLNRIKYSIAKSSSIISKLSIRRDIIIEAQREMEQKISNIDVKQLEILYSEAESNLSIMNKTFEDLLNYHNHMIVEKVKFITQDLPDIESKIQSERKTLSENLKIEKELTKKISKSDSFEELEKIISELTEKYRRKGEFEAIIAQITEVSNSISQLNDRLSTIDEILYSEDFENRLKEQISKFNKYFSAVSNELYGEQYALTFDKVIHKKTNKPVYRFNAFNTNMSSGKKQGEILCFDLAYILFADAESIPTLHFLLNDKKELMHDNQLLKVAEFVKEHEIQLVISMLKDKLPEGLIENSNVVVELSQESKLFKIENLNFFSRL